MKATRVCVLISCLAALGCGQSQCPPGTARVSNRCMLVAESDAGRTESSDAGLAETETETETEIDVDSGLLLDDDAGVEEPDAGTTSEQESDGGTPCTARGFFLDADGDGHGDPETLMMACEAPDGHVESDDDCDDTCPTCFEGATESCDEVDQDCDGIVDEDLSMFLSYVDLDGDGFGEDQTEESSCMVGTGRVQTKGDCDDRSRLTHPDASEVCNEMDDDCDGQVDEHVMTRVYRDADGDGFGSEASDQCGVAAGFTTRAGDCADGNASVFPGAPETCDGLDNDCDTQVDEGVTTAYYADCDGDGYAAWGATATPACALPPTRPSACRTGGQWVTRAPVAGAIDCDDSRRGVSPGVETFSSFARTGTNYDYNCDSINQRRWDTLSDGTCPARVVDSGGLRLTICSDAGWRRSIPACGETGTFERCNTLCQVIGTESRVQECR